MSGETGSNPSTGDTMHGQASETMHGHVNSIKAKLGLDSENSLLGRLKAHTRRKLSELEAARAAGVTAVPGSPDWQAAMKPESFSKGFIRANRTQFLITASIFSVGLFWLLVIRFVHHNDNLSQTGNSEVAQKALAARQMNGGLTPQQAPILNGADGQAAASGSYPGGADQTAAFGVPNSTFGSPNAGVGAPPQAQNSAAVPYAPPAASSFAAQQAGAAMPIGTFVPQVYSPYAQQGSGQSYQPMQGHQPMQAQPIQAQPMAAYPQSTGGYAQPTQAFAPTANTAGLYPVRTHSTARHQVVVNR